MGRLVNLPNELLELVVDYCDYEDVRTLRATCKAFQFTDVTIFDTICVAFFTSFLDRFTHLTRNPRIAALIKSIEFVGDILPEIDSIEQYEQMINLREPWKTFAERFMKNNPSPYSRFQAHKAYDALPRHELTPPEVSEHFEKYKSYRLQQLNWGQEHDDLFIEAFCRLPNLFVVRNRTYSFADNNEKPPWKSLQKEILVGPNNWMQLHAIEADDEDQEMRVFEDPLHMRHARCLLSGITFRDKHPESQALGEVKLYNMGGQPFFEVGPIGAPSVPPVFGGLHGLTTLQLNISYRLWKEAAWGSVRDHRAPQLFDELHAMLSAAPAIKTLSLKFYDEAEWAGGRLAPFPGDNPLLRLRIPKLEHLSHLILTCAASEDRLLNVLQNHAATLRVLELIDVHLESGGWRSLIERLPNVLRLEHVYLEGLRDEQIPLDSGEGLFEDGLGSASDPFNYWHPHNQAVYNFILNGGDMPELNLEDWLDEEGNENLHDDYMSTTVSAMKLE